MIEVYLFHLLFTAQVLLLSLFHPRKLLGRVDSLVRAYPPADYPRLYPSGAARLRRWRRLYLALNLFNLCAGFACLAWFIRYMSRPDWSDGQVELLVCLYFILQCIPMVLAAGFLNYCNRKQRQALGEPQRKTALLRKRGILDFVSPLTLILTLALYPVSLAAVLYINRNPFPGFAGTVNILAISLLYLWAVGMCYFSLYGKKANPYQGHEERLHQIGITVRIAVYTCLAGTVFLLLNFALAMYDYQSYEPLACSLFFVFCALSYFQGMSTPLEKFNMESYRAGS